MPDTATVDTTSMTLGQWLPLRETQGARLRVNIETLIDSGVAREDLDRFGRSRWSNWKQFPGPPVITGILSGTLKRLAVRHPDLTVHAAMGWATLPLCEGVGHPWDDLCDLVSVWAEHGLGESGWLFAAARMTPDEASAALSDASQDAVQAACVLAALNEVPISS